jgi:hypothetical protein
VAAFFVWFLGLGHKSIAKEQHDIKVLNGVFLCDKKQGSGKLSE